MEYFQNSVTLLNHLISPPLLLCTISTPSSSSVISRTYLVFCTSCCFALAKEVPYFKEWVYVCLKSHLDCYFLVVNGLNRKTPGGSMRITDSYKSTWCFRKILFLAR